MGKAGDRLEHKLRKYVGAGKLHKCRTLLKKHPSICLDARGSSGATALHLASGRNRKEIVEWLVRHGACTETRNCQGETAAHLAARTRNWETLEWLLDLGADPNATTHSGVSVRELAAAAQQEESSGTPTPTPLPSRRSQSDTSFYNRLAEEISHEAGGDDAFFGTWVEDGSGGFDSMMDDDAYCARLIAEARRRQQSHTQTSNKASSSSANPDPDSSRKQGPARPTSEQWEQTRQASAAEAERLTREEEEKDRLWRKKVLQGKSLEERKRSYESLWTALEMGGKGNLRMHDIPWPAKEDATEDDTCEMLLYDVPADRAKQALREEVKRWHPDKFQQRLSERIAEDAREQIMTRVNQVSNVINTAWSNLSK